jgi:hypothetical protein
MRAPYLRLLVVLIVYGALAFAYRTLQDRTVERVRQAEEESRELKALIPICAYCRKVRDDEGYWHGVESYLAARTGSDLSHGVCPDCLEQVTAELRGVGSSTGSA